MGTKPISIIVASPEDFAGIADIYNESVRKGGATMDEVLKTESDIAGWVEKFNDREGLFAMKIEERLIGWGIIKKYSDREGYRFACETAIYLTEEETGKGYGGTLKRFLIKECEKMKYRHLVAKIFAINHGSISYNEKLGYTVVGVQKNIGYRNGSWQDVVIMQYLIEEKL